MKSTAVWGWGHVHGHGEQAPSTLGLPLKELKPCHRWPVEKGGLQVDEGSSGRGWRKVHSILLVRGSV